MDQLVGQNIGRYQLLSLLGQGGMGAVFRGRDITLQRDVAIKVMHPHIASQPGFQERFLQEARTAAHLDHPGVVKVFDFNKSEDQLYIVMEFIVGSTLEKVIKELRAQGQWMSLSESVQLVRQVALAMDYIHKQGVLHRDLKPDNIMLKPVEGETLPYRPVITDLGLAKLTEGGLQTQTGMSLGTPAYMSPEQAMGQPTVPASDVYSLGILLYELATGQLPFPIKNLSDAIICHTQQTPPAPRSIQPQIPEALETIIMQALEKDPAKRFPDAGSLAKALENALPKQPTAEVAPTNFTQTISLITQVQKTPPEAKSINIMKDFGPVPPGDRDQVQVLMSDKTTAGFPFKMNRITIGRDNENDIILKDAKASRQHARIEFDGKNYRIIDLNSSNGTYLDDVKLLPGVAEIWPTDKPLLIGDTWFRLIRVAEIAQEEKKQVEEKIAVKAEEKPRSRLGVQLQGDHFTVEPGQMVTLTAQLMNQGPLVEHLKSTIEGIPANWVSGPDMVQLMPGTQQSAVFTICPPRTAQSLAKDYPINLKVVSQDSSDQFAQASSVLTVLPFCQFISSMHPKKFKAGKAARIKVDNQGNAEEFFNVAWQDPAAELNFEAAEPQIKTPAGNTGQVEFRARPREKRWFGGSKLHTFTAEVSRPGAASQTLPGEVISRAVFPPWLLLLLLLLCIVPAVAAYVIVPPLLDTDRDGLSNSAEAKLGTNPNVADTDGDGLTDGDEVKKYGTNPLDIDTDKDTLTDGAEVASGCTSPNNPDTDGDGIPDNVDPSPCAQSTPTPLPSETPVPSATPVPTVMVCPDTYGTRLHINGNAKVMTDPPISNNVRDAAGLSNNKIGVLKPGTTMSIIGGPKCEDNMVWWEVNASTGLRGWTSEGDAKGYWLEPLP